MNKAQIGIIGGSGFYDLASDLKEIKVETPYGPPSEKIGVGKVSGRLVAFLPRHNKTHDIPPHKINNRANIWAFHSLGVDHILTVTAVGSLQTKYRPGSFLVIDQFIDRTWGRKDSFYDGPIVTHISSAYPYCPQINKLALASAKKLKLHIFPKGTVVIISGPRFSTAAESAWYTKMGWDVINMTQYPEVILAKELGIGYTAIALVTDYDAGLVGGGKVKPVSAAQVHKIFGKSIPRAKLLVLQIIKNWPAKMKCNCAKSLEGARIS
jgi:5'-methylthioadenosine phosphorylase